MDDSMVGADADVLTTTARQFGRSADALRLHRAQLGSIYAGATWSGPDADRTQLEWRSVAAPALLRTSEFLAALEVQLLEHAAEQRRAAASGATDLRGGSSLVGFVEGEVADAVDHVTEGREATDTLLDRVLAGGSGSAMPTPGHDGITGLRPSDFEMPRDGRAAVIDAMQGLAHEARIGRDEIEIRALDNGRYVVVLPGVTDLSAGVDQFVDRVRDDPFGLGDAGRDAYDSWADNDEPTVRKMRYAFEAAIRDDTTVNEYSVVTAKALQDAGVPAGADVMLIGHSFGAYTAMDLAADPAFNAAHGARPDGYHVAVTHVIAAGAETDWRFDEVPAGTNALVINNRVDLVYRAEDILHRDGDARHPGHLEQNFWGDWRGKGHDEHNYIEWLADTGNDGVEAWLDGVGDRYRSGGSRVSVRVPDPNL